MNILLDTHYLIWAFTDTGRIQDILYKKLLDDQNDVYYSQASLWELSIKYRLGKITIAGMSPEEMYAEIEGSFLKCKTLSNDELVSFHRLPIEHKDPFDRLLIWQCIQSGLHFLSVDGEVDRYQKHGLKILA
jgi:PIN domain nuclease of toxin-antitoxin system